MDGSYNIDTNDKTYLDIWIDFSKKSTKFKEGYCEKMWANMKNEGFSIASLYFFAKKDNPAAYKQIIRNNLQRHIDSSVENNLDYDLAKVLYEMYKHEFVCASSKKSGLWYHFDKHRWVEMESDTELFNKISTEMCNEYCIRLSSYNT